MALPLKLGREQDARRRGYVGLGVALSAVGLLLVLLAAAEGHDDLLAIGGMILASGLWVGGGHRSITRQTPGRAIVGGLFTGWAVIGALAAIYRGLWPLSLLCLAPLCLGLLILGLLPVPGWAQRPAALLRTIWPGLAFIAAGAFITLQGIASGASAGVAAFVPLVAGLVFLLGGVLWMLDLRGGGDTIVYRTLVALLVSGLMAVAIVLPPALLLMAPFALLAWIAVLRLVVERLSGRDPLAGWSELRVLGLAVALLLGLLLIAALQLRSDVQQPAPPLPLEAVE